MFSLSNIKIAFFDLEDQNINAFIAQCQEHSIDMCLVSYTGNSSETQEKLAWTKETYGVDFEVCSAPSIELTFAVMETMSKLRSYEANEVLLVSTNIEAMELAKERGFLVPVDLAKDFTITNVNRGKIGYTNKTRNLVIPTVFYDEEDGAWYKVTEIEKGAFRESPNLESVVIGNAVTSIGDFTFAYCANLKSVVISDSVTDIKDFIFYCCSRLDSVVMGNSITIIGDMVFKNCVSLTSINIPNSVTSIGIESFYKCCNLTLRVPSSVVSISQYAFYEVPTVYYTGDAAYFPWGAVSVVPKKL